MVYIEKQQCRVNRAYSVFADESLNFLACTMLGNASFPPLFFCKKNIGVFRQVLHSREYNRRLENYKKLVKREPSNLFCARVRLPDKIIEIVDKLVQEGFCANRSAAIRVIVTNYILEEERKLERNKLFSVC